MATVVRIKRRCGEEPLENVLISCKKSRSDKELEGTSTVLKFAGTVQNQEEDIVKQLKSVPKKSELEENYKKHSVRISEKLRQQNLLNAKENRFKIVNRFRSNIVEQETSSTVANKDNKQEYTIYDIECDENQNSHSCPDKSLEAQKFVYDVYYTSSDGIDFSMEDYVEVYTVADDLIYGLSRDNVASAMNESGEDSEDSNAENYWTNDYPDEDEQNSVNEEDMIQAVENMNMSDNALSTDEGEENYAYGDEEPYYDYVDDTDDLQYGKRYAEFKARYKKATTETPERDNMLYYGDIEAQDSD